MKRKKKKPAKPLVKLDSEEIREGIRWGLLILVDRKSVV